MANGSFATNPVGGMYPSPTSIYIEWGIHWQNEDAKQTAVWWNARGWGGAGGGYYVVNYQARAWVDGANVMATGQFNMTAAIFGSGDYILTHDGNGDKHLSISADGRLYYNTVNTSGSGGWWLPNLYQGIAVTGVSFTNYTDVGFQLTVTTNRTANLLQLNLNGGGFVTYHSGNYSTVTVQVGSPANPLRSGYAHSLVIRVRRASNGWITDAGTYYPTTLSQNKFFDIGEF